MENFHGHNLNPHNINKLSCTRQSLQETQHLCHPEHCLIFIGPKHQAFKIYEYLTKSHIKSNQHINIPNAFSNYVKTTLNHELSLSEVDLADLKRETSKHGPSLMEVDWRGNMEPKYTSSGCMLMQFDWGGKLRVNHINKCVPSEVDGELMKPIKMDTASLKLIWEVVIQVFTLWMDACSLKLIGEPMIQVFSITMCTLIMMQSQRISSPKNCGKDYIKGLLPTLSWST